MLTKIIMIVLSMAVIVFCLIIGTWMMGGPFISLVKKIQNYYKKVYLKRKEELEIQEDDDGRNRMCMILHRLDRLLEEAGIRRQRTYITAEIYLVVVFLSVFVFSVGTRMIWDNSIITVCVGILVCFVYGVLLYVKAGNRYKKTEQQLLIFINLLDNYSRTSDDLVEIIARTEKVLEEPLKSAISEFHWEAVHTGEIGTALRHLSVKLPHAKLKEVIRNLDICRRHEANYAEIIRDIRTSMKEYLHSKEERKTIRQTSRVSTVIMCAVGVFILNLINGFMGGQLWYFLIRHTFGVFVFAYLLLLGIIAIISLIKIDKS